MDNKKHGTQSRIQVFAWWYVDTFDYRELLERDHTHLIAMTGDGNLISEEVSLREENRTAYAMVRAEEYILLPQNWVTPKTEHIEKFWLTNDQTLDCNDPEIEEIYRIIETGASWKTGAALPGVRLFGNNGGDIASRLITAIVPIGNDKFIASNGHRCTVINKREHDRSQIMVAMKKVS